MKGRLLTGFVVLGLFFLLGPQAGFTAGTAFAGKVVRFDPASRTLAIRGSGATVTFDVSAAVLKGYRSVDEIRSGDTVEVSYTPVGVRIVRCSRGGNAITRESPKASRDTKGARTTGKLPRRQPKGNGMGFEDSDVNKDGKITPVELSVVIPDITMIRFREYDTNRDGCLSRLEFARAMAGR